MRARAWRAVRLAAAVFALFAGGVVSIGAAGWAYVTWPAQGTAVLALLATHYVAYRVGVGRERERGRVAVQLAAHMADEAETSGAIRRRLAHAHAEQEQAPHVQRGEAS